MAYVTSPAELDAFVAANRLLAANEDVYRVDGRFLVTPKATTLPLLQRVAADRGISFAPVAGGLPTGGIKLTRPRIGL